MAALEAEMGQSQQQLSMLAEELANRFVRLMLCSLHCVYPYSIILSL